MAAIRNQLRIRFAVTISFLLVACSAAIWLWARYLADRQVRALLRQDVNRLSAAITWNPDLGAFELHTGAASLGREFTSDYWQVCDSSGARVWKSESRAVPEPRQIDPGSGSGVMTLRASSGPALWALRESIQKEPMPARRSMFQDFPEPVMRAARELAGSGSITATELEFADNRLIYEVTFRQGDNLVSVEMDGQGQVVERSQHRVPTLLPEAVLQTLAREYPGATVQSFDWRAAQGHLQFIVNASLPDGRPLRQCISSAGQEIPLYFPEDRAAGRTVAFDIFVAGPHLWRSKLLERLGALLAMVCGAGLVATIGLSEWLTYRTLGPIARIAADAGRIDDRRLSERLSTAHPEDEIGRLVAAINGMLDRIETAFERQRRFARDASHELRGPLAGLIAHLELARGSPGRGETGHLDLALERAQRLRDLVEKLLLLARQDSDKPVSLRDDVDLRECLVHVAADFPEDQRRRIELFPAGPNRPDLLVRANEELLHSMFRNIVENALKFSPPGSIVQVRLSSDGAWHTVEVCDAGSGIPPELHGRIFEPFVRLENSASLTGAGLGLSIVRWIATLHGARIEVGLAPGGHGTCFRVQMPSAPASPP